MSSLNHSNMSQPLPLSSSPLSREIDNLPSPYREFMRPFSPIVDPSVPLFSNGRQSYFPSTSLGSSRYLSCPYRFQALRAAIQVALGLVFSGRGLEVTAIGMDMSDAQLADDLSSEYTTKSEGIWTRDSIHETESGEMMARLNSLKQDGVIPIVLRQDLNRRQWAIYTDRPTEIHLDMELVDRAGWALMTSDSDSDSKSEVYHRHVLHLGIIIDHALQVLLRNHILGTSSDKKVLQEPHVTGRDQDRDIESWHERAQGLVARCPIGEWFERACFGGYIFPIIDLEDPGYQVQYTKLIIVSNRAGQRGYHTVSDQVVRKIVNFEQSWETELPIINSNTAGWTSGFIVGQLGRAPVLWDQYVRNGYRDPDGRCGTGYLP